MYDKRRYGHLKATLYLEMNLEYFLTQVKAYAETQDLVALIGNGSGNSVSERIKRMCCGMP